MRKMKALVAVGVAVVTTWGLAAGRRSGFGKFPGNGWAARWLRRVIRSGPTCRHGVVP